MYMNSIVSCAHPLMDRHVWEVCHTFDIPVSTVDVTNNIENWASKSKLRGIKGNLSYANTWGVGYVFFQSSINVNIVETLLTLVCIVMCSIGKILHVFSLNV